MPVDFKPLEIKDKQIFNRYFKEDPPETSELTFTNLFMWQSRYHPVWAEHNNVLLTVLYPENSTPFGLPPVGKGNGREALDILMNYLEKHSPKPEIQRAGENFVSEVVDKNRFTCTHDRDNSDYVYSATDLIKLSGRKYHRKKNHVNQFKKRADYKYKRLDQELVECFMDMQEEWCRMRECYEVQDLLSEDYAIRRALINFEELNYRGGAIVINNKIEAFSLGEKLNDRTAVIHIEKANPEIPGLYAAVNQMFCENEWSEFDYINREQDLGVEGLRKAKESYLPHHMVNKYTITLQG